MSGPRLGGGNVPANSVEFVTRLVGHPAARGALPVLRAATDPEVTGGDYLGPDGLGGARGRPVKAPYSNRTISEQLTEIRFPALVCGR